MLVSLDMRIEERRPPRDMLFIQITCGVPSQHAARSLYIANIGFSPERNLAEDASEEAGHDNCVCICVYVYNEQKIDTYSCRVFMQGH